MKKATLLPLLYLICLSAFSQADVKKNTVRFNISNPLIFGKGALVVGYERVISKNQSFSVNIGSMSLPKFISQSGNDSLKIIGNSGDKGFHISADYRFYLAKENKYEAPRGVYIGPYYSYNYFSRSNDWLLNSTSFNGNVGSTTKLDFHTVGFELGYQFIFWKKLSVDMILLGPGVAFYSLNGSLDTNLNPEQEALFFERLNEMLADKIPGYNIAIKEGEFSKNGSARTTSLGYRYMINIGFRF